MSSHSPSTGAALSQIGSAKGQRVLSAMLSMNKMDIGQLEKAYDGK